MRTLLKNGRVVNVFIDKVEDADVLIQDNKIIGVDKYSDVDADNVIDITGKFVCPSFIDGHIHIESTNMMPSELAKICIKHGSAAIVADPHEIANVSGAKGILFMLEASKNLPMTVYIMLPSCVPATPLDENGAVLTSEDLKPLYQHPRVLGLAEMMNYPGLLFGDKDTIAKCEYASENNKIINGHAPLLSGKSLDKYLSYGINDDHESTSLPEAMEKLKKGQWVMIRQGTCAKNLEALLPLFDEPFNRRCILVTDDKQPADLMEVGHIDSIIRYASELGKSVVVGIRMATLQAAQCFGLKYQGAIAPGYLANLIVLDDLNDVRIRDVYHEGKRVVRNGVIEDFKVPEISQELWDAVQNTFHMKELSAADFHVEPQNKQVRVIKVEPYQVVTEEWITDLDFSKNNGIDLDRDILKLAVCERHNNTGHIGLGYINGITLKKGAIAASIAHDSHNLIIIGTNEEDMALAGNHIRETQGGTCIVADGKILADMPLPIGGLMSDVPIDTLVAQNKALRQCAMELGVKTDKDNLYVEPFMSMYFVSLSVIPNIKMLTYGLIDVDSQKLLPLFVD